MAQNRSNFADAYREIYEKLKPSDGAGAYIDDFRKSDAPQFKGKSDEKIQKMAIAAYLDDKDKAKKEDKDMDPRKHVARSKKNPDKFCVFDKDGNEVKLFDTKADAEKYAIANHDKLMEELEENRVFVVRFLDPKNKKRFAVPYKDKKSADDKMKQLKRDGVKEIEVTKDLLKRGVKFKEQYELKEDGHTDVASAKRDMKTIVEDAQEIEQKLNGMNNEDSLPSWWTNMVAVSASDLNSARDYILNPTEESVKESQLKEAKFAVKLSFLDKPIYIDSESAGKVKMGLRKALKKPEAIISVDRVMPADYKADLRDRIKGKKDDEDGEEKKEALDKEDEPKVKEIIKKLKGASKAHAGQASDLEKAVNEAANPAQQAAIAISMKKAGKKPKNEDFDEPEFSKKNFAFNKIGLAANKNLKKKELGKHTDEGRKSKYDMDQDDEEGANKNIMMQLRKSVDLKGRFDVEFEDGKKVKVKDTIARAAVLKHAGMRRPAEKLAFQKKIEKSYRDLLNALKGR